MNQNERLNNEHDGKETLIERFKRFYELYRKTSDDVDTSFTSAYEALTLSVMNQIDHFADQSDVVSIRDVIREYREIRGSIQGSNDSVKERFELEHMKAVIH